MPNAEILRCAVNRRTKRVGFGLTRAILVFAMILALSACADSDDDNPSDTNLGSDQGGIGGGVEPGSDFSYVGSKKCKKCHLKEWKSWDATPMSKAFDLLMPGNASDAKLAAGLDPDTDYTGDITCLPCHTVGFGKDGGFFDAETTPDLAGVGCESCHGAGGSYTLDYNMSLKNKEYKKADVVNAGLVEEVGIDQCLPCHNENSPTYRHFYFDLTDGIHERFPLKYNHD